MTGYPSNAEMKNSSRLLGMDLVRIFSCICILCVHESYIPKNKFVASLFGMGAAGVQFFFIISGYFAARYFSENPEGGVGKYYRNRLMRIVPAYYLSLLSIMLWYQIDGIEPVKDILHLGWLRYFCFLNTVIPSSSYDTWNNVNGLWTLSGFMFFYLIAPWVLRRMSLFKSALLLVISFVLRVLLKYALMGLSEGIGWVDKTDVLIGSSPIGVLWQFILGVLVFYALKEKRWQICLGIAVLLALAGIMKDKQILVSCSVGIVLTMAGTNDKANRKLNELCEKKGILRKVVLLLSGLSFYIYLFHVLAYEISSGFVKDTSMRSVVLYIIYVLIILGFCSICCKQVEKVLGMFGQNKTIER